MTEWRSRRWRRLLNLIDGLRLPSEFVQARMDDDEYAAAVLAADLPDLGEQLADWSPEVNRLVRIEDLLQQLLRATISATGAKGGKFKPAERPRTAFDRVKTNQQWAEYDYLMGLFEDPE